MHQLHEGRLKDLTYQLISLGGSSDFTQEWVRSYVFATAFVFYCCCLKTASVQVEKNEELYANSLANTCLRKLLAPQGGKDESILQQVKISNYFVFFSDFFVTQE